MASVSDTITAINDACRVRGGAHAQYSCKSVSWDDVQRGTVGGSLSCWGSNITDTRLYEKNGRQLFTVRPDNWNEKLGKVSTGDVALLIGNEQPGGTDLKPLTLRQYLKSIGEHGSYAGLKAGQSLHEEALDREVSIRFQTTFLPVEDDGSARETLEFAPEAYNYCTQDDADPRNLVLLCTTQGTAVQQDGKGAKKLYHHAVDEAGSVHRYWLEAEASSHKVGGAQKESAEEKADALARGKATASVIGVKAMGTRFNVLMTIQVPLQQKPRPERRMKKSLGKGGMKYANQACEAGGGTWMSSLFGGFGGGVMAEAACFDSEEEEEMAPAGGLFDDYDDEDECFSSYGNMTLQSATLCAAPPSAAPQMEQVMKRGACLRRAAPQRKLGRANAARVSRGSEHDTWAGLSVKEPKRNDSERVTVTVVIYNTVAGGVPSQEDVAAAVEDMEALYAQCVWSGHLADDGADFMKAELTVADTLKIAQKVTTQPYVPPSHTVVGGDAFPVDDDDDDRPVVQTM